MGQLTGHLLKFTPEISGSIYQVGSDGLETGGHVVGQTCLGSLVFLVPPGLVPDSDQMEVCASVNSDEIDMRVGELHTSLLVA